MIDVKITDYDDRNGRNKNIAPDMISYYMKNENKTTFAEIFINELKNVFNGNKKYNVFINLPESKKERVKEILDNFGFGTEFK
jgi:ATP phosphoribosyltransferase